MLSVRKSVLFLIMFTAPGSSFANAEDNRAAMLTATRELRHQVDMLQELFGSDNRLARIVGLFPQTTDLQLALVDFRRQVASTASHEEIAVAFDVLDRKLTDVLNEVSTIEKEDAALRIVCRRLRAAENALHFTVFSNDMTPARVSARLYRQTLSQETFVESLANNVSWVYANRESLPGWQEDLGRLQKSLNELQRLEQNAGTPEQVKTQFLRVSDDWGAIVRRYQSARRQDALLLQSFIALVDQGFGRVAPLVGVNNRTALPEE